ncbi:hypothetical protein C4J81_16530 [Deltaproteobacteria bacterium Smac51]|nr:hypothetical protein C4J81_16530 [Deltaproteobacteria bacterium Smac51]
MSDFLRHIKAGDMKLVRDLSRVSEVFKEKTGNRAPMPEKYVNFVCDWLSEGYYGESAAPQGVGEAMAALENLRRSSPATWKRLIEAEAQSMESAAPVRANKK